MTGELQAIRLFPRNKMISFFLCALVREVIEGDPDAVGKRAPCRIPFSLPGAVVAEPPPWIMVDCVLPPVTAKVRIEVKRRFGLRVEPRGDLKEHLVEPARP